MKKFVVFSILALATMVFVGVSATPAHAVCITLTNFCDTVQLTGDPGEANHLYGKWDWVCVGVGTSIYGANGKQINVGTRPVYGTYTFAYTASFVFTKSSHLFDLVATNGDSAFFFQSGQPWTSAGGSCGLTPHARNGNLRSALGK